MTNFGAFALLVLVTCLSACGPQAAPGSGWGAAPDAELAGARRLAASGKLDEALATLAILDAAHPADARVALLAGEVATWRGSSGAALVWMRRAAERAPSDPDAHLRAAYVLLVHPPDGAPDAAAALVEAASALADAGGVESGDYRACRGEAAWATGASDDAERWFRGALELRSDCRWALQRLLQIVAASGAAGEPERQVLNERLSALLHAARTGEGMENARMPVSFCGH